MPKRKPKRPPPSSRMPGHKQVSGFISVADYDTIKQAATAAGLTPWLFIRAAAIEKAHGDATK